MFVLSMAAAALLLGAHTRMRARTHAHARARAAQQVGCRCTDGGEHAGELCARMPCLHPTRYTTTAPPHARTHARTLARTHARTHARRNRRWLQTLVRQKLQGRGQGRHAYTHTFTHASTHPRIRVCAHVHEHRPTRTARSSHGRMRRRTLVRCPTRTRDWIRLSTPLLVGTLAIIASNPLSRMTYRCDSDTGLHSTADSQGY